MVIVEHSRDDRRVRIQARSNFSLGRGGFLILITSLSAATLLLAVVSTWHGYWPILAIAVVQVVLLVPVLLRAWKSAWTVETITVESEKVFVLQETWTSRRRRILEAPWARVWLEPPMAARYPPRVILGTGNQQIELGAQLNVKERKELASALREAIVTNSRAV